MTSLSKLADLDFRKKKICKVGKLLETLDKADAEILESAVFAERMGMRYLAQELTKRGLPISETPLYRHRAKSCGCFLEALG